MAQESVFRGTARSVVTFKNRTEYRYHHTAVITICYDGSVVLNSGGWHTATTKRAINQVSNQLNLGFKVFQKDFDWFVAFPNGETIPFEDGLVLFMG